VYAPPANLYPHFLQCQTARRSSVDGPEHASRNSCFLEPGDYLYVLAAVDCSYRALNRRLRVLFSFPSALRRCQYLRSILSSLLHCKVHYRFQVRLGEADRPPFASRRCYLLLVVTVSLRVNDLLFSRTGSTTIVLPTLAKVTATDGY